MHAIRSFRPAGLAWLIGLWLIGGAAFGQSAGAAPSHPRPVNVILWFDTEDYLLPASDDSVKRLATLLSDRGIRATFKVVGERARTLERRGRWDVIEALRKHDIGYHANFHSVHPTPSEYLAPCGLLDGIQEFVRREGPGAADVRRIFRRRTLVCYGQPGASWAAQAMAGLKAIGVAPRGVPCYVDDGSHIGLDHQPFWFEGVLTSYDMGPNLTRMDLHDRADLAPAQKRFSDIAERLRRHGGGLISIYFHPCEWVHRQFWDAVNFSHGANPPRELWKAPPQLPPPETEAAFAQFEKYVDYIRSISDVRFVTAGDLPLLYPDAVRQSGVGPDALDQIARQLLGEEDLNFLVQGKCAYSAADQFALLTEDLDALADHRALSFPLKAPELLGPDSLPDANFAGLSIDGPAFRMAVRDAADFLAKEKRIPARVFIGAQRLEPGRFLYALAWAHEFAQREHRWPDRVPVKAYRAFLPASHVAKDTPDLFGSWIIHPEGFRAPKILDVARLQTWTLKPAIAK